MGFILIRNSNLHDSQLTKLSRNQEMQFTVYTNRWGTSEIYRTDEMHCQMDLEFWWNISELIELTRALRHVPLLAWKHTHLHEMCVPWPGSRSLELETIYIQIVLMNTPSSSLIPSANAPDCHAARSSREKITIWMCETISWLSILWWISNRYMSVMNQFNPTREDECTKVHSSSRVRLYKLGELTDPNWDRSRPDRTALTPIRSVSFGCRFVCFRARTGMSHVRFRPSDWLIRIWTLQPIAILKNSRQNCTCC